VVPHLRTTRGHGNGLEPVYISYNTFSGMY
jgi:hypothetical protein